LLSDPRHRMTRKNEARICEAMTRLLENEIGKARSSVEWPEKDHSGPPVDLRVTIGGQRFAIEHTLVEPFQNFTSLDRRFVRFAAKIEEMLKDSLPKPGVYRLIFPLHPTEKHSGSALTRLEHSIVEWARSAAQELLAECESRESPAYRQTGYHGRCDV